MKIDPNRICRAKLKAASRGRFTALNAHIRKV